MVGPPCSDQHVDAAVLQAFIFTGISGQSSAINLNYIA